MREICADIRRHVGDVAAEWERLLAETPPTRIPADFQIDKVADFVLRIVRAVLCRPEDEEYGEFLWMAIERGMLRRSQGMPEHVIYEEYFQLQRALWNYVRTSYSVSVDVMEMMGSVSIATTHATNAALLGYHREEIEEAGRWHAMVELLPGRDLWIYNGPA